VDILDNGSLKLQYNRNRYYDQYTGRWLTQDPLGYVDGMNLYDYVRNDPVGYADPFGNHRDCTCKDCEHFYWKRCWVTEKRLKWKVSPAVPGIVIQNLGTASLVALTSSLGGAARVAGEAAGIIIEALPSLRHIYDLGLKASRTEHYSLAHFRCGDNCRWDFRRATITIEDVEVDTPDDGWWDLGSFSTTPLPLVIDRTEELIQNNRGRILRAFEPGRYCKTTKLRCKRGEWVERQDGARPRQKCEEFKWKTRYED